MHIEDVPYQCDGMNMIGHLAFDDQRTGTRPAVLVSHEGSGLDQHAKGIAERLAALGYDLRADRRSWHSMLELFSDVLGPA